MRDQKLEFRQEIIRLPLVKRGMKNHPTFSFPGAIAEPVNLIIFIEFDFLPKRGDHLFFLLRFVFQSP